ncbi:MAG: phage tail protein [Oscillospiraceae bacterium]|nr:phage tail protein [Oscillospiraceae bacterium]
MNDFFHGVKSKKESSPIESPATATSGISFVVGTAPVHTVHTSDGVNNAVNVPLRARNFAEAGRLLGYSDDWKKYDLCEVMFGLFNVYKTSPVIFVNVLDPSVHKKTTLPQDFPVSNGKVFLPFEAIKSTVTADSYVLGKDYELFYSGGQLVLEILDGGSISPDTEEIGVGFDEVDPSAVTASDIIGGMDVVTKKRSGLELIGNVFPKYRTLPDICLCPNWSSNPDVAAVMTSKIENYNGIFNGKSLCDVDTDAVKFYDDVPKWANDNGFNSPNQVLCFPLVANGGRTYHMSTHMAGLMASVDKDNGFCPCESPSNKPLSVSGLVLADGSEVYLELEEANFLNENGVTTALNFTDGFVLWGNFTTVYPSSKDPNEYFLYASRMFDWIRNTIILSHWSKVDGKITSRFIESIIDSINVWFNTLVTEEKILGGRAEFPSDLNNAEDFRQGKIKFKLSFAPPGIAQEIEHTVSFDSSYIEELIAGLGGGSA